MPEPSFMSEPRVVRYVQDIPFCIERAIVRLEKAQKSMKGKLDNAGVKADISVALHYLREVRRGL